MTAEEIAKKATEQQKQIKDNLNAWLKKTYGK